MPSSQALGALLLASAGFIFGLALDFYQVLRRLSNPGRLITIACDLFFWLAYSVWIFVLLLKISGGEVRYHVFLSIASGAGIYFWLFSRRLAPAWHTLLYRLMWTLNKIADGISRALDICLVILLWPYRMVMRFLFRPLWSLLSFLLSPLCKLLKFLSARLLAARRRVTRPVRRHLGIWRRRLVEWLASSNKDLK